MYTSRLSKMTAHRRLAAAVSLAFMIFVATVVTTTDPDHASEVSTAPEAHQVSVNTILVNGFSQSGNPALLLFTIPQSD